MSKNRAPPPGWTSGTSGNLYRPWSCERIAACTGTHPTEQEAIDEAWELADAQSDELETERTARERAEGTLAVIAAMGCLDWVGDEERPCCETAAPIGEWCPPCFAQEKEKTDGPS